MSKYKPFAHTVKGISHEKHGKECEDACAYQSEGISYIKQDKEEYQEISACQEVSIAVVADGHGDENCFRSAKGSLIAVKCAVKGIGDFVNYLNETEENENLKARREELTKKEIEKVLKERLIQDGILRAWYRQVAEDFTNSRVTEEELKNASDKYRSQYLEGKNLHHAYGSTLIAAAVTGDFWFGFHIGDGQFTALYSDGSSDQPVPWDDRCFLNRTTSICDDDAIDSFRCYFSFHSDTDKRLVAIFLCTDGIDDNYPVEGNAEHLFKLYRTIALAFANEGYESTREQLKDLVNQFATKGKGDDTSIAVIIDEEGLQKTVPIWEAQIKKEEASEKSVEEAAQAESANVDKNDISSCSAEII